jgi:hypothetical protein
MWSFQLTINQSMSEQKQLRTNPITPKWQEIFDGELSQHVWQWVTCQRDINAARLICKMPKVTWQVSDVDVLAMWDDLCSVRTWRDGSRILYQHIRLTSFLASMPTLSVEREQRDAVRSFTYRWDDNPIYEDGVREYWTVRSFKSLQLDQPWTAEPWYPDNDPLKIQSRHLAPVLHKLGDHLPRLETIVLDGIFLTEDLKLKQLPLLTSLTIGDTCRPSPASFCVSSIIPPKLKHLALGQCCDDFMFHPGQFVELEQLEIHTVCLKRTINDGFTVNGIEFGPCQVFDLRAFVVLGPTLKSLTIRDSRFFYLDSMDYIWCLKVLEHFNAVNTQKFPATPGIIFTLPIIQNGWGSPFLRQLQLNEYQLKKIVRPLYLDDIQGILINMGACYKQYEGSPKTCQLPVLKRRLIRILTGKDPCYAPSDMKNWMDRPHRRQVDCCKTFYWLINE